MTYERRLIPAVLTAACRSSFKPDDRAEAGVLRLEAEASKASTFGRLPSAGTAEAAVAQLVYR
jgi:hypothetical protein